MTSTMTYKGYAARIEYDDEGEIFMGRIAGTHDFVGFHADTVEGLRVAFHEVVNDYIETSAKIGKKPEKTYSGQMSVRINPDVHRKAVLAAQLSGKSLNQWTEEVLDRATGCGVASSTITIGKLTLDLDNSCAFVADEPLKLTVKEYELLKALAVRKGQTVTKESLMSLLYNNENEPELKIIDVFVCKLRKKLAKALDGENLIDTIWGRGYTMR
jgi:predicted HicB family RNase H-like nuclease